MNTEGEDGLALEISAEVRFRGDGMEMGEVGLRMELQSEGREETRVREGLFRRKSVSSLPELLGVVKRTSTLITRRRPRPMGGANSWTGARNSCEPISIAGNVGCSS